MRVYAHEEHKYTYRFMPRTIAKGETVDVARVLAERLVAANPDKLQIVAEGESPPDPGEYATTFRVYPHTDRRMIPAEFGRVSDEKIRLLKKAKAEGRHHAFLTIKR